MTTFIIVFNPMDDLNSCLTFPMDYPDKETFFSDIEIRYHLRAKGEYSLKIGSFSIPLAYFQNREVYEIDGFYYERYTFCLSPKLQIYTFEEWVENTK